MAELTAELPDVIAPSPEPAEPAEPGVADDLLSKMAGAEIDRLIAEADVGTPLAKPSSAGDSVPGDSAPASSIPAVEKQLDELFSQIESEEACQSQVPPAEREVTPETAVAATIGEPGEPVESAPAGENETAASRSDEEAISDLERQAIASMEVEVGQGAVENALSLDDLCGTQTEAAPPATRGKRSALAGILLRPLEIISAPLDDYSPGVRAMLGRIAIATLVNAAAILVYVLVFRRHPGFTGR